MSTFYKRTKYNGDTLNQMWMSILADSHDIHCECDKPFAHLLNSIFPEGHIDRQLTIQEIIDRDSRCPSGGDAETNHGIPLGGSAATGIKLEEKEGDLQEEKEDIEMLLAAAAAEEDATR